MNEQVFKERISRREFLTAGGVSLAGLTLACGGGRAIENVVAPTQAGAPVNPGSGSETLLFNGKVVTVDPSGTTTQAVLVRDGLIHAIGRDKELITQASESARLIDLIGKTVTPGLIDPHVHFRVIGLDYLYFTPLLPPEVKDTQTLLNAIANRVGELAQGEWMQGYYLVLQDNMFPDRYLLDTVSPNNPVFIMHIGGHWGSANSAAINAAGITASTPSPEGGVVEKDANGEPTGLFYNHRAMDLLRRVAPPITFDLVKQAILNTQPLMAACGVTSYQDNNVRGLEHIRAYQELAKEGKLTLRSTLYLTIEWLADMDKVGQLELYQDGFSRIAGYKFLIDGQSPTAFCHQPHSGTRWDMPTWNPEEYKSVVKTLHDTGLQVCTHCIGDAAADLAIDAYKGAMNANPRSDPRHRLEHAVLTTPQATPRLRDLGIIASTNPHFIFVGGDGYENIFGVERMPRLMVTREWLDAGVHVTIGSDAPSVPFHHPAATMSGAISRLTFSQNVIGAEQALTFDEALRAHTIEAAYAAHEETIKGSLEPGKLADLVVWEEDPGSLSIKELANTKQVNMTMVGGEIIHQL